MGDIDYDGSYRIGGGFKDDIFGWINIEFMVS